MNNSCFKSKYDIVIIGGGLSGLGSALTLAPKSKDILVLEQHNLLGGVASSFVRDGIEYETALHEMMSIGSEEEPLSVGKFLKNAGVDIKFIRVPEAYRLVTDDIDIVVHAGENGNYEIPSREIAEYCCKGDEKSIDDLYNKILAFFKLCKSIYDAIGENDDSKFKKMSNYMNLIGTAGYSSYDVLKSFGLPEKAIDILSAYWMYLGNVTTDLPFSVFAILMADYFGYGSHIPSYTSHELSLKMAEKAIEKGVQIECNQRVDKILVENSKVKGVRLSDGTEIACDYVISGAYPNKVYTSMIEPREEIKPNMIKFVNAREMGCTCFSVIMLLDKDYHELGITNYATFYSPNGMNMEKILHEAKNDVPWNYLTIVCNNIANPNASPEGTCMLSITNLPFPEAFKDLTPENYEEMKKKHALHFIELESKRLGVNLLDHIQEITILTPVSISHFVGAWNGGIYGFRHSMDDHVVARIDMKKKEQYISGLYFNGAHQSSGDGIATVINTGRSVAVEVLLDLVQKRRAARKNGN